MTRMGIALSVSSVKSVVSFQAAVLVLVYRLQSADARSSSSFSLFAPDTLKRELQLGVRTAFKADETQK
jgi:hypothetical protein